MIRRAHRRRKELGAGMRQTGILAAAGLYAIEHHLPDLERDHFHARRLADGLAAFPSVHVRAPQTNIVLITLVDADLTTDILLKRLRDQAIAMVAVGPDIIRATIHRDLTTQEIDTTILAVERALNQP